MEHNISAYGDKQWCRICESVGMVVKVKEWEYLRRGNNYGEVMKEILGFWFRGNMDFLVFQIPYLTNEGYWIGGVGLERRVGGLD